MQCFLCTISLLLTVIYLSYIARATELPEVIKTSIEFQSDEVNFKFAFLIGFLIHFGLN